MSQTQQVSAKQVSRQLYNITRSEASWLVKNYKKALKKAAEIEPYRVFRDALETQKPAYLGKFNNSLDAEVQGTFYAMALHIYNVVEKLFKQAGNLNHDAKVSALCKHLPTSLPIAYQSIGYLNWSVYNWFRKNEIITEDFTDTCLENTTCAICNFKGEAVFYFSTAYGLEQPVCEKCIKDEEETKSEDEYVMEEESESEGEEESDAEHYTDGVEGEDPLDEDYEPSSESEEEEEEDAEDDEAESDEAEDDEESSSDAESEDERTFGCAGCPYEFKQGWKTGYKAAMKELRNYADDQKHNVPDAPQCEVCEDSHENLKKCGRCNVVRYCSTECQEEDWPEHKQVCRR
jgi:hypothetical protein